jgi:hypothetical protein
MLTISPDSLREGCERAQDLFALNRLRSQPEAAESFDAVFAALGFDDDMRSRLHEALVDIVPVKGNAVVEAGAVMSMIAGVLVGLLIADSTLPADELDLPVATT